MKNFINTVKQTIQVGKGELVTYGVVSACGGLLGVIIWTIVAASGGAEGSYGTIGAMMALMFGMLGMVIMGIFSLHQDFNMAISLGKTRRQYVPAKYLLLVLACLFSFLMAIVICQLELLIYPAMIPGGICEFNAEGFLLNPVTILGFVVLVPMVIMLCGAFYLRFGMKFFWVGWVFWMCLCTLLPRMLTAVNDDVDSIWKRMGTAVLDFFMHLDSIKALIGIVVIGGLGLFGAFKLLSKQRVTL